MHGVASINGTVNASLILVMHLKVILQPNLSPSAIDQLRRLHNKILWPGSGCICRHVVIIIQDCQSFRAGGSASTNSAFSPSNPRLSQPALHERFPMFVTTPPREKPIHTTIGFPQAHRTHLRTALSCSAVKCRRVNGKPISLFKLPGFLKYNSADQDFCY